MLAGWDLYAIYGPCTTYLGRKYRGPIDDLDRDLSDRDLSGAWDVLLTCEARGLSLPS